MPTGNSKRNGPSFLVGEPHQDDRGAQNHPGHCYDQKNQCSFKPVVSIRDEAGKSQAREEEVSHFEAESEASWMPFAGLF